LLFNTAQFALFFVLVLVLVRSLSRELRPHVLLAASLVFYTLWIPAYLLLLLVDVGVNYVLLRRMLRSSHPRRYLALSVVFTLGLLAYFKYAGMILGTLHPLLEGVLGGTIPEPFLPLGISFYSFQILALSIDACRGHVEAPPRFSRYLLFVSFFPQLIAGPILRGPDFLPQLARGGSPNAERDRRGLWLIVVGLAKKVILADALLAPFVDEVFAAQASSSAPFNLIALYSFAFQIYFDFSGYCDMARGMALLLGFELPLNFKEPYLSRDPSEFWRRWHITLSRWLADYLYIPLGGNRRGASRTYVNLMLTMLLGGLWHGASWTFVVWGGLHGLLLVIYRLARGSRAAGEQPLGWRDAPRILVMFHLTCLIWVFFRASGFDEAVRFLGTLVRSEDLYGWPVLQTIVVLGCFALHPLERFARAHLPALRDRLGGSWIGTGAEGAVLGAIVGVAVMLSGTGGDFIYFQF
jgi:D-alanyl-lipoteichoic acid acyltransferase DltB (MBOAT superfamily)